MWRWQTSTSWTNLHITDNKGYLVSLQLVKDDEMMYNGLENFCPALYVLYLYLPVVYY